MGEHRGGEHRTHEHRSHDPRPATVKAATTSRASSGMAKVVTLTRDGQKRSFGGGKPAAVAAIVAKVAGMPAASVATAANARAEACLGNIDQAQDKRPEHSGAFCLSPRQFKTMFSFFKASPIGMKKLMPME